MQLTQLPMQQQDDHPARSAGAGYPFHFESSGRVLTVARTLFDHLDDPTRLSGHMEKDSITMAGASMSISTDDQGGRAIGSMIRMNGKVLGIPLGLEEVVTERVFPRLKSWETVGAPRLLVIGGYRMGFRIEPQQNDESSMLTVFIDYSLPSGRMGRWLGRLLGSSYARWCCRQMVQDAQLAFAPNLV